MPNDPGGGGIMLISSGVKLALSIITPTPTFAAFCEHCNEHKPR